MVSLAPQQTRLNTDLLRHLQKTLVACGCFHCVAHREFTAAWMSVCQPKEKSPSSVR